jgi:hypothetical protein
VFQSTATLAETGRLAKLSAAGLQAVESC